MIVAIYNCLTIPFIASLDPELSLTYDIFDYIIDALFVIDVVISFRITYVNSKTGLEVFKWYLIAWNYIKFGRFFIDAVSVLPFENIYILLSNASSNSKAIKSIGLLKLIRLLRLGRIIRFMKFKSSYKTGMRILQLLFFIFLIVHWVACILYLLVKDINSWMPPKDANYLETNFYNESIFMKYCTCFYYAILTMQG